MSKNNITKQLAQAQPGALHVGVDLALEKNVIEVINEKAVRLDRFSFLRTGEAMITFCGGWKGYARSIKPLK